MIGPRPLLLNDSAGLPALPRRGRTTGLTGRRDECDMLDRLITAVQAGTSRALVVRGNPGAGKTALLEYLAGQAADAGCALARMVGAQPESERAFAGLQQLCEPMLSGARSLPLPQRDALRTAFRISAGPPPDQFLVGAAVLSLLSEAAGESPLIYVLDDVQWMDQASVRALGFAARRLAAHRVGLVFATREPGAELTGLPELHISGLRDDDARVLLASALAGPLDTQVRDLIVAETHGNPRALLELPRGLTPTELAGGFGVPGAAPLAGRAQDGFVRQLGALPDQTRRLVQLAAADPSGDGQLLWRAADRLAIPMRAAAPAVEAGLVEFGGQVRFPHPLARFAVYWSASKRDRRAAHATLAEATDPVADSDRRAWHKARAAAGPVEEIAADLERSAGQAQARGGLAAAAAFLERSVLMTTDPARHAERTLAAAQAHMRAGAFDRALDLLAAAEAGAPGPRAELAIARAELLRGQISFASGSGRDAPALLFTAAKQLAPLHADLAREAYLTAWLAAFSAGRLAAGGDLLEVCRAAQGLALSPQHRTVDLVLEGLTLVVTDGPAVAVPTLRRAVRALTGADIPKDEILRWGWLAQAAASALWDNDSWHTLLVSQVGAAREAGALDQLPVMLDALGTALVTRGDLAAASVLVAEAEAVRAATGTRAVPCAPMMLAALRGREADTAPLIEATITAAKAGGQGVAVASAHWAAAVLYNGLGRYEEAMAAARQASEDRSALHVATWALPELIEAATRTGNTRVARNALIRLAQTTYPCGTDFALGVEARCRALLTDAACAAQDRYREAIDRLGRTGLLPELARTHLLYGEWLHREGRSVDAREQLRTAHDMLSAIGMASFAERARRELVAAGERTRKRTVETVTALSAQEAVIAKLARDGRTNREIGAQLYLSTRTIEWHLRKIFAKLGISSRRELHVVLPQAA